VLNLGWKERDNGIRGGRGGTTYVVGGWDKEVDEDEAEEAEAAVGE
jgi:hypothetical protein